MLLLLPYESKKLMEVQKTGDGKTFHLLFVFSAHFVNLQT